MIWAIEPGAFANQDLPLREAIARAGHKVQLGDDSFPWEKWVAMPRNEVSIFHGSLNVMVRIFTCIANGRYKLPLTYICSPSEFFQTRYSHLRVAKWMLNSRRWYGPIKDAVALARIKEPLFLGLVEAKNEETEVFVRPNSCLKEFSGRVLKVKDLTLEKLDYGYYFNDQSLDIVIAPVKKIISEWRFVIVDKDVVTGCLHTGPGGRQLEVVNFAQEMAELFEPKMYVMDVCETSEGFRIVELNPFCGADFYACNPDRIVDAVANYLQKYMAV